jgi:hypothetical protein
MQKLDDNLSRRLRSISKGSSIKNGKPTLTSASHQNPLDEIGGEPLAGSGFENEAPEAGFAPEGEES